MVPLRVRFYGHFGHATGYGRAATDLALALLRHGANLKLDLQPLDRELVEREIPEAMIPALDTDLPDPDVVLVLTLPYACGSVLAYARKNGAQRAKAIAYTVWESFEISPLIEDALDDFDAIWSPSKMSVSAFQWVGLPGTRKRTQLPVLTTPVPHCVDEALIARAANVPLSGDRHRFLWIGRYDRARTPRRSFVPTRVRSRPTIVSSCSCTCQARPTSRSRRC